MKKTTLTLIFLGIIITAFSNNVAILISLNGQGSVVSSGTTSALKVPMTFKNGDVIKITQGSADIMYFSGKEENITANKKYIVTEVTSSITDSPLLAVAQNGSSSSLLAQSGSVYNIRGVKHIFPTKSKVQLITDSVRLVFKFEDTANLNLVLYIKESKMQKEVYKQAVHDTIMVVPSSILEAGKTYHWSVTGAPRNMPELGVIVVQAPSPIALLPSSKKEYLNAISQQYEAGMYFSALALCIQAKEKFPDTTIFHVMYENILQ